MQDFENADEIGSDRCKQGVRASITLYVDNARKLDQMSMKMSIKRGINRPEYTSETQAFKLSHTRLTPIKMTVFINLKRFLIEYLPK